MKTHRFSLFFLALAFGTVATAQVYVQPVTGVHTVKVEDAVTLNVYPGDKTQIEANTSNPFATVAGGIMSLEGDDAITLRLNPADGIVTFSAEGVATIRFVGPFDFGDRKMVIIAEDNAKIEFSETVAGKIKAGHVVFDAQDNARIVSELPLLVNSYNFKSVDNSYIEVPSIKQKPEVDSTVDRSYYYTIEDNGNIVIRDQGSEGVFSSPKIMLNIYQGTNKRNPSRDFEFNCFWGFSNWGDSPLKGFSGINGDAEVSHYFMNVGFSIDYPLVNTSHFGLYAGLGIEGNRYHFTHPLVSATPTGFQISPASVTYTPNPLDPNNWDTYFNTLAMTVPITFSFEPWKYDDFCIRLTAIPGINVYSILKQTYDSKAVDVTVSDKECSNNLNPFMLDARLTLMYGDFGLYAQVATLPLFKDGFQDIYPVKFGLFWTITGR